MISTARPRTCLSLDPDSRERPSHGALQRLKSWFLFRATSRLRCSGLPYRMLVGRRRPGTMAGVARTRSTEPEADGAPPGGPRERQSYAPAVHRRRGCFSIAADLSARGRPHRLEVRTSPFQGENPGSIPGGDARVLPLPHEIPCPGTEPLRSGISAQLGYRCSFEFRLSCTKMGRLIVLGRKPGRWLGLSLFGRKSLLNTSSRPGMGSLHCSVRQLAPAAKRAVAALRQGWLGAGRMSRQIFSAMISPAILWPATFQ